MQAPAAGIQAKLPGDPLRNCIKHALGSTRPGQAAPFISVSIPHWLRVQHVPGPASSQDAGGKQRERKSYRRQGLRWEAVCRSPHPPPRELRWAAGGSGICHSEAIFTMSE